MPQFVRVRVKSTGALITIDAANVNDTVEVVEKSASTTLPEPKTSSSPKKASAASAKGSGSDDAGDAGTDKGGSK